LSLGICAGRHVQHCNMHWPKSSIIGWGTRNRAENWQGLAKLTSTANSKSLHHHIPGYIHTDTHLYTYIYIFTCMQTQVQEPNATKDAVGKANVHISAKIFRCWEFTTSSSPKRASVRAWQTSTATCAQYAVCKSLLTCILYSAFRCNATRSTVLQWVLLILPCTLPCIAISVVYTWCVVLSDRLQIQGLGFRV